MTAVPVNGDRFRGGIPRVQVEETRIPMNPAFATLQSRVVGGPPAMRCVRLAMIAWYNSNLAATAGHFSIKLGVVRGHPGAGKPDSR